MKALKGTPAAPKKAALKGTRKVTTESHGDSRPHAHDHSHDHGHPHAHDHSHHSHDAHEHGSRSDGHPHAPLLARGSGKGKILFFDAPAGLAGDMIIAALVDLGVPQKVIEDSVARMKLSGFHLHFGTRERSGIVATAFDVHLDDKQPERTWGAIRKMIGFFSTDGGSCLEVHQAHAFRSRRR